MNAYTWLICCFKKIRNVIATIATHLVSRRHCHPKSSTASPEELWPAQLRPRARPSAEMDAMTSSASLVLVVAILDIQGTMSAAPGAEGSAQALEDLSCLTCQQGRPGGDER